MKIISTPQKKIMIEALDLEIPELLIDYEAARRIGGYVFEVVCYTFKNEDKRDQGQVLLTNVPAFKMTISANNPGVLIRSNLSETELTLENEVFALSGLLIEKCIRKCYESIGYTLD